MSRKLIRFQVMHFHPYVLCTLYLYFAELGIGLIGSIGFKLPRESKDGENGYYFPKKKNFPCGHQNCIFEKQKRRSGFSPKNV